ncbi:hypothetical protein J7E50_18240 [Pedobacter sp. ISL-68]|uniref:hypothetical protein n=1 Tax=unclassified Pedobacter TaxID=2628915 RepID=UPI001BEA49DD|nr:MULTISPECIES: hypothetical protein [unclassified Pedobacter]MBT2559863.1 hypothetical protein [Pedobacter sp. ISL-64]MBT2592168.1 hypothetical protein [Pedobacter sp. ISL-68]
MKSSDKPTEYLMLKAKTDSEWDECDYAIIRITENWREQMQTRLDAIAPFSGAHNGLCTMDYFAEVYFYKDDNDIDSMELLGEQHWSFVIPNKKDIKFLSANENRTTGCMLEIATDGWANYSTHRLQDEESWTVDFSIAEVLQLFDG